MKILFAVSPWGMGHVARDTPLIEGLLKRGHLVDILSTGRSLDLLRQTFKRRCRYFDTPTTGIPNKPNSGLIYNLVMGFPAILYNNLKSRLTVKKIIREGKYDKVISDTVYEAFDREDNSYLICHHIGFRFFPEPNAPEEAIEKFFEARLLSLWKHKYILVPDSSKNNLSGKLSHKLDYLKRTKFRYFGMVSRIRKKNLKKDIDYFVSLSIPSHQREMVENKILSSISHLKGNVFVTLGKPGKFKSSRKGNIRTFSILDREKQEEFMNRAKFVITIAGYSTMMELCELGVKKALIIPLPGWPEQNYLARYYQQKGYFHYTTCDTLDLEKDISLARKYNGFKTQHKTEESVKKFVELVEE